MRHLMFTLLISCAAALNAQDTFVFRHLKIDGNRKTRPEVFMRETGLSKGDMLPNADSMLPVWQKRFAALGLFNEVRVSRHQDTLLISVKERIYTWALPELTWADRNFNVWWQTRDPERLVYGATIYFNNIRGLNHNIAVTIIHGYNRSYSFQYNKPFSRHTRSWGYSAGAGYWSNHELWYKTREDKLQFLSIEDRQVQRNFWVGGTVRRRLSYFSRLEFFTFGGGIRIDDSAARRDRAPVMNYAAGLRRDYLEYGAQYISDHRDQRHYPASGHLLRVMASHNWMNISTRGPSVYTAELRASRFIPLPGNTVLALFMGGRYRYDAAALRVGQLPYIMSRQLGYGNDYVRGYEPYVADGSGFVLGKTALRKGLGKEKKLILGRGAFLKNYRTVPLSIWLSIFADAGRIIRPVNMPENTLNTQWMAGSGIGLDVVAWYTAMARAEISRNRMGTWIFNLSYTNAF